MLCEGAELGLEGLDVVTFGFRCLKDACSAVEILLRGVSVCELV